MTALQFSIIKRRNELERQPHGLASILRMRTAIFQGSVSHGQLFRFFFSSLVGMSMGRKWKSQNNGFTFKIKLQCDLPVFIDFVIDFLKVVRL